MTGRFAGYGVVVTGAAAGIGRATALAFAREGAGVTAVDRDADGLALLVGELGEQGATEQADLAEPSSYDGLIARAAQRWGRLDVLVNNAADLGERVPFTDLTLPQWQRVITTNLTAPAMLARDAARAMLPARRGVIINVSSIQAHLPLTTHVAYGASKGGLESLTAALAAELGAGGIRINAVAPGVVAPPGVAAGRTDGEPVAEATLTGRSGEPDDVAATILFLASAEAVHINGITLTVDGGRRVSRRPDPFAAAAGTPNE